MSTNINQERKFNIKEPAKDSKLFYFPDSSMVRSPPASAGDKGFGPWSRKAPHATEQLESVCRKDGAHTPEPLLPGRGHCNEKLTHD